jgi:neutral ceramidase
MSSTLFPFFRFFSLSLFASVLVGAATEPVGSRIFRAGAAASDITPEIGQLIIGGFSPTAIKHIHDQLWARALVIDDGTQRLAFVVCDNIGLPKEVCDEATRLIHGLSGLDRSHVLISATHTHSAGSAGTEISMGPNGGAEEPPPINDPVTGRPTVSRVADYQHFIAKRIADAVQRAINQLEPARIGWGRGQEPTQVFNRRWFVGNEANRRNPFGGVDQVRMNPSAGSTDLIKPAGPTDPEVSFISVQAKDGRPLALLASYSLHYVGGVPAGVVSSDYFGLFCRRLEKLLATEPKASPPFVGILANGTSGDINNVDFRQKSPSRPPFEKMHQVANAVAAEVFRAYQTIEHRDWVSLDARYEELKLGSRRPTPEMIAYAKAVLARPTGTASWHPREQSYARRVLQKAAGPEFVDFPLQAFRVGELAIMSIPAEPFAAIGLELKSRSPLKPAFTIGLANAYYGYLPSDDQHPLGGYETWVGTNRVEVGAAPKIVDTLLRLVTEMQLK